MLAEVITSVVSRSAVQRSRCSPQTMTLPSSKSPIRVLTHAPAPTVAGKRTEVRTCNQLLLLHQRPKYFTSRSPCVVVQVMILKQHQHARTNQNQLHPRKFLQKIRITASDQKHRKSWSTPPQFSICLHFRL